MISSYGWGMKRGRGGKQNKTKQNTRTAAKHSSLERSGCRNAFDSARRIASREQWFLTSS